MSGTLTLGAALILAGREGPAQQRRLAQNLRKQVGGDARALRLLRRRVIVRRIVSPADMPSVSLTCLKRSTSTTKTDGRTFCCVPARRMMASSRSKKSSRFGRPVRLSCTASCSRRSSELFCSVMSVMVPTQRMTSPFEPTTGRARSDIQW